MLISQDLGFDADCFLFVFRLLVVANYILGCVFCCMIMLISQDLGFDADCFLFVFRLLVVANYSWQPTHSQWLCG